MEFNNDAKAVPMRLKNDKYTATVPTSSIGFYNLAVVRNQSQLLIPIYFGDAKSAVVNVKIDGRSIIIDDTPDNRALTTLGAALNALDRRLWMEEGLNGTQMTELILGYKAALD
jgi:hypothetical protein